MSVNGISGGPPPPEPCEHESAPESSSEPIDDSWNTRLEDGVEPFEVPILDVDGGTIERDASAPEQEYSISVNGTKVPILD